MGAGASAQLPDNVTLDEALSKRLARLRVRVLSVTPSADWARVFVVVQLPLFLGRHNITLWKQK